MSSPTEGHAHHPRPRGFRTVTHSRRHTAAEWAGTHTDDPRGHSRLPLRHGGGDLGGQLIARRVQHQLGFTPPDGASFLPGYGSDTGRRWHTFCSILAATPLS